MGKGEKAGGGGGDLSNGAEEGGEEAGGVVVPDGVDKEGLAQPVRVVSRPVSRAPELVLWFFFWGGVLGCRGAGLWVSGAGVERDRGSGG